MRSKILYRHIGLGVCGILQLVIPIIADVLYVDTFVPAYLLGSSFTSIAVFLCCLGVIYGLGIVVFLRQSLALPGRDKRVLLIYLCGLEVVLAFVILEIFWSPNPESLLFVLPIWFCALATQLGSLTIHTTQRKKDHENT